MVNFAALRAVGPPIRLSQGQLTHVEDAIHVLFMKRYCEGVTTAIDPSGWLAGFLISIHEWTEDKGRELTTAQARNVLRMLKQSRDALVAIGVDGSTLDRIIANPTYRRPVRQSVYVPREARAAGQMIALRGKSTPDFTKMARRINEKTPDTLRWDFCSRTWAIRVRPDSHDDIIAALGQFSYACDDGAVEILARAAEEMLAPPVFYQDGEEIAIEPGSAAVLRDWMKLRDPATPHAAKRYLRCAALFNDAIIDPELIELADSAVDDPALTSEQNRLKSELLQLDFRAAISLPPFWQKRSLDWLPGVVAAMMEHGISDVALCRSAHTPDITDQLVAAGLDVHPIETYDFLEEGLQTIPRSSVLLHMDAGVHSAIMMHFPRTIVIADAVQTSRIGLVEGVPTRQEATADRRSLGCLSQHGIKALSVLFRDIAFKSGRQLLREVLDDGNAPFPTM